MNKIQQNKLHYTIPTSHVDYDKPQITFPTKKCGGIAVESNLLIQGKLQNNLNIDGVMAGFSFEHPFINSADVKEDYCQFVEPLRECYGKIFQNSSNAHIKQELTNLCRSNYQITHCRQNDFVSINKKPKQNVVLPKHWPIDSTYQSAYHSPAEQLISDVGGAILKAKSYRPSNNADETLSKELRKIFPFGKSAYQMELCNTAERFFPKHARKTPLVLDKYSTYRF